jgi:hypothetical protein
MAVLIPAEVTRFVLTCIRSVPHLEALLLLRGEPEVSWDDAHVAQRLYVTAQTADDLLVELHNAGFLSAQADSRSYRYAPVTEELSQMIDQLADIYSKNIVAISNLIHSSKENKVQQFADAFKWRKDS